MPGWLIALIFLVVFLFAAGWAAIITCFVIAFREAAKDWRKHA